MLSPKSAERDKSNAKSYDTQNKKQKKNQRLDYNMELEEANGVTATQQLNYTRMDSQQLANWGTNHNHSNAY